MPASLQPESDRFPFLRPRVVKVSSCLLVVTGAFIGIAFLPGKLEGVYGGHVACACGSTHLADYREGKMILHGLSHPPAEILCRYETDENNVSTIYSLALRGGEEDRPVLKAYPHLLITRFVKLDDGSGGWEWKRPIFGSPARTMRQQEITSSRLLADGTLVTTYYDAGLNPVRHETRPPRYPAKSTDAE